MTKDFHREVVAALREHRWERVPGGKDSHEKWRGPTGGTVTVPRSKSRHTANAVLKQAGIDKGL